ncbi:MAG: helix-turn-helix domain-containing protein [Acidimicrobiia bacterium]|nr:helix-turn-helix domain-containing protein [Acidimicrobiia bacterium]
MHKMHSAPQFSARVTLLTTQDVQRLIKVDRSTIYRMAEDGRLPAIKVGRQWRFPEDGLQDFLRGGRAVVPVPNRIIGSAVEPETLAALADFLGEAFGAMVVLTDIQGRPLTTPANPCGLFEAVHRHPGVLERCIVGWQTLAAEVDLDPQWRATPLGFLCARSLIREDDRLVGMVLVGGVAPAAWPPEPEQIAHLAADLGVPTAVVQEHCTEVHYLEAREMARALELLPRAAALLTRLQAMAAPAAEPSQRSDT